MPTDATFHDVSATTQPATRSTERTLPAGAGLALAVIMGSVIWIAIFAMLM